MTSVIWNAKNCDKRQYSNYSPFHGCTNIKSFEFGNEVKKIPEYLLKLSGLTSITIPKSVTYIGYEAFSYCYGLTSINAYPNPAKVSMEGNVFYDVPINCSLHVLPKYLSAYLTANQWRDFFKIEADLTEIGDINADEEISIADITALTGLLLSRQ